MAFFARKVFGAFCLALFIFACCLTSGLTVLDSAMGGVLTFSIGCGLLVAWKVVRETLQEVAAALAEDRVFPVLDIDMAEIVPAGDGQVIGLPVAAAAAFDLVGADVSAGQLIGLFVVGRVAI
jgi:hypothetical protein